MPIYKQTTELTKCADWLTAAAGHDIQWVYFGDKEVFTVWDTYSGTLPAQFSANGDDLKAYQIYGNTGGVGKETGNLISDWTPQTWVDSSGNVAVNPSGTTVEISNIDNNENYILKFFGSNPSAYEIAQYNGNNFISREVVNSVSGTNTITLGVNTSKIILGITSAATTSERTNEVYKPCFTKGSTAPESYIPYGYELDILTQENLFDKNNLRPNESTLNEYGAIYTNAYCSVTPFIPINGGSTYDIRNADTAAFCWYTEEKTYISGERYDDRQQFATTAPQNAAYIRCTVTNETTITTNRNIDTFMLTESGQETTIPICIGETALEKDEYVDSSSGKVYRRTENLFDGKWLQGYYAQSGGAYHEGDTWICFKNKIPCKPNTAYTLKYFNNSRYYSIGWYTENNTYISMATSTISGEGVAVLTATSPANAAYLSCSVAGYPSSSTKIYVKDAADTVLIEGSTAPSTHIPYLQPTDPPVALPAIPTVDGTTIVEVDSVVQPEKVHFTYRKEDF